MMDLEKHIDYNNNDMLDSETKEAWLFEIYKEMVDSDIEKEN
jgi:hypothetical protein